MFSRRMLATLVAAILIVFLTTPTKASIVTFNETEFADTQWTASILVGSAGGQTASQVANGGNTGSIPDAFRSVRTNTNGLVVTFHSAANNTYDPSLGAITSLDFSLDFRNITLLGDGQLVQLAIEQAGVHYLGPGLTTVSGGINWTTFDSIQVTSDDFTLADFTPGTPDFTSSGTPITFGFSTANNGGNTIEVGYDNWTVNVAAVPEPSSFAMMGACVGFCILRRRQ